MNESEFFALGETFDRVELFDGSLHVTVNPGLRHQHASGALSQALDSAVRGPRLKVLTGVNVRLTPARIPTVDLVVTTFSDVDEIAIDAGEVQLICEILSPGNHAVDTVLKRHYYAAAGIPTYLIVDPHARTLQLLELAGDHYSERPITRPGDILRLTEPVRVDLVPEDLLPD